MSDIELHEFPVRLPIYNRRRFYSFTQDLCAESLVSNPRDMADLLCKAPSLTDFSTTAQLLLRKTAQQWLSLPENRLRLDYMNKFTDLLLGDAFSEDRNFEAKLVVVAKDPISIGDNSNGISNT
jgi:hypothetical protein